MELVEISSCSTRPLLSVAALPNISPEPNPDRRRPSWDILTCSTFDTQPTNRTCSKLVSLGQTFGSAGGMLEGGSMAPVRHVEPGSLPKHDDRHRASDAKRHPTVDA